jgi:hypothetical protein
LIADLEEALFWKCSTVLLKSLKWSKDVMDIVLEGEIDEFFIH